MEGWRDDVLCDANMIPMPTTVFALNENGYMRILTKDEPGTDGTYCVLFLLNIVCCDTSCCS